MYKEEGDFLIDIVASRSCVTEKTEFVFDFDGIILFLFVWIFFTKHSKTVSYFVFSILVTGILPLDKTILMKILFVHFISLNITILLCLQFSNSDCSKILTSVSQLYHLTISCVKINGQ